MWLSCFLLGVILGLSVAKVYDVTTIYRREKGYSATQGAVVERFSLEVHARTNALGLPYHLPNGTVVEPQVGVAFPPFISWAVGNGWEVDGWTVTSLDKDPAVAPLDEGYIISQDANIDCDTAEKVPCERKVTSRSGSILYNNTQTKCWNISVPDGFHVYLKLEMILPTYLPAKLLVYDGPSSSAPFLANLTQDSEMLSSGNRVYLEVEKANYFSLVYKARGTNVMKLTDQNGSIKSPAFDLHSRKLCVSIHHYQEHKSSLEISFQVKNEVEKIVASVNAANGQWITSRLVLKLDQDLLGKNLHLILRANGNKTNKIFLERISGCNPNGMEDMLLLYDDVEERYLERTTTGLPTPLNDSHCMHGLWDKESKECNCVPGYSGKSCEISCGANQFGHDCLGTCSYFDDNGKNTWMCKYGLGCNCLGGYGGRNCEEVCSAKSYGPSCQYIIGWCSRGYGDHITGLCTRGCIEGFYQPYCQQKISYLVSAPEVKALGVSGITVKANLSKKEIKGVGRPLYYQVQYKMDGRNWIELEPNLLKPKIDHVIFNITGLIAGGVYCARNVLITEDLNVYQRDDVPENCAEVHCIVPDKLDINITISDEETDSFKVNWKYLPGNQWCLLKFFQLQLRDNWRWRTVFEYSWENTTITNLLPGKEYRVRLRVFTIQSGPTGFSTPVIARTRAYKPDLVYNVTVHPATSSAISLEWEPPRDTRGGISNYTIQYSCKYEACLCKICPSSSPITTNISRYNLKNLTPHTKYWIKLNAVGKNKDKGEVHVFEIATLPSLPEIAPTMHSKPVLSKTFFSLKVQWLPPLQCEKLNGYLLGYRYRGGADDNWVDTRHTIAKLTSLKPNNKYSITVLVVTTSGWNEKYPLIINASTYALDKKDHKSKP
ncbi:angiopoietin-1 receptor isoform X2 [Anabrus simplex]